MKRNIVFTTLFTIFIASTLHAKKVQLIDSNVVPHIMHIGKNANIPALASVVAVNSIQVISPRKEFEIWKKSGYAFLNPIIFAFILVLIFSSMQYRIKQRLTGKIRLMKKNLDEQNTYLYNVVKEKAWLVEELHHRVKNNLQVALSLLDSQSAYLTNTEALHAVKSSQHRMYAISLVHQKLYEGESLAFINMEVYINELLQYLQDEYKSAPRVVVDLNTIPLNLNLASAIPLGLIINEVVTNTLQYAFPKHTKGEIKLTLAKDGHDHYLLQIADNGIGLPPGFDATATTSLGTSLIAGLSRQIHARLEIKNINGVMINLRFKPNQPEIFPLSA